MWSSSQTILDISKFYEKGGFGIDPVVVGRGKKNLSSFTTLQTNQAILIILVQLATIYVLKMLCKFEQNQLTSFGDIMAAVWKNRVSRKTRLKVIVYPVRSIYLLRFTVVTYERLLISKNSFTHVFYTCFRCDLYKKKFDFFYLRH